eukprot:gene25116-65486_t
MSCVDGAAFIVELRQLSELHRAGDLTDGEFAIAKARLLGPRQPAGPPPGRPPSLPPPTAPSMQQQSPPVCMPGTPGETGHPPSMAGKILDMVWDSAEKPQKAPTDAVLAALDAVLAAAGADAASV